MKIQNMTGLCPELCEMKLSIIQEARDFLDLGTAVQLYTSLTYSCTSVANLQKLQKLQNSACRTLLRTDRHVHITYMHQELKFLILSERRDLHMAAECYKHVHKDESSLNKLFEHQGDRRNRTGDK